MLKRLSEFHHSIIECLISIVALIGPSLGTVIYCALQVSRGHGLEQFRLGFIDMPRYLGAGASYMDVLILDGVIVIALIIATVWRWHYYRDERDFLKKHKIKGETGFSNIFKGSHRDNTSDHDRYDGADCD